jgi:anaerobic magnesium-protoporphyrin IX monomethyl ester cyclase
MKILFIQFPWTEIHKKYEDLAKIQGFEPPLGICYLAAIAEKRGHEVKILDFEVEQLITLPEQIRAIMNFRPDILGITSTTPCYHKIEPLTRKIKELLDVKIIVGGPHMTVLKEAVFFPSVDFGVYGEGELTFAELLKELEKKGKKDYSKINGLIYWKNKKIKKTPPRMYIENLDSLDFPARHLLKLDMYKLSIKKKGLVRITNIMAMRGCPYDCVFCSAHTMWGRKARFRSPSNVVDEIEECHKKYNISHFVFTDSTLTLSRKQVEGICHELIRRGLKITWEGWTRANLIDEPLLRLMKSAGFNRISVGIESGDPNILKLIKKEVALQDIRKIYQIIKKLNIEATCSVMIGHPGETKKTVMKTINFVRSIPEIKYSGLSIATPYPGTELRKMAENGEHGLKLLTNDYRQLVRYDTAVISVNDLSPKDLIRYQKWGMLYIQMTPGRILYNLRRTSLKDAYIHAKAFLKTFI